MTTTGLFWTIGGLCLLGACFLAWRDEHRAREKAERHTPSLNYEAVEKLAEARRKVSDLEDQLTPRIISSDQRYKLLLFLKTRNIPSSSVGFWHYVSTNDGEDFSRELSEVFKHAGWNADYRGISARAVHSISVSGGTQQDKDTLIKAMYEAGLRVQIDLDRDVQDGPMDVIVGPKPSALALRMKEIHRRVHSGMDVLPTPPL